MPPTSDASILLTACKNLMQEASVKGTNKAAFITAIDTAITGLTDGSITSPTDARMAAVWNFGNTRELTCSPCQAAKNWMLTKDEIKNDANFKCYYFEKPDGSPGKCDPKDTTKYCVDANGNEDVSADVTTCTDFKWRGDCMKEYTNEKGLKKFKATLKSETCDFATFATWYKDVEDRIKNAADRMDAEIAVVAPRIERDLRAAVNDNVIERMYAIVDGMKCGFMAETFGQLLDGMCRKMVPGVGSIGQAYTALGFFLFIVLAALNYTIWRYVGDNIIEQNAAQDETE
jgi:hypothetical protein